MTTGVFPANPMTDEICQYDQRQQLSALIDGELAADQARFLVRRIGHDQTLSACQERWQLIGDVLRGQADRLAPADFRAQIQQALAIEIADNPRQKINTRWRPWSTAGMMLAASLAAVSVLFVSRTAFFADPVSVETTPIVSATSSTSSMSTETQTQPQALIQYAETSVFSAVHADPFAWTAEPVAKPWPRSTLPAASRTFNVRTPAEAEALYPFTLPDPLSASDFSP